MGERGGLRPNAKGAGASRPTGTCRRHALAKRSAAVLGALGMSGGLLTACSSGATSAAAHEALAPAITARAPFSGRGAIYQAYETGAKPGEKLLVANSAGRVVGRGVADRLGSLIVRNLSPGPGYTFRSVEGREVLGTSPFSVLSPGDTPPASFYASQHLHAGLNYITTRSGVQLAATVRLPPGKTLADGPFPTVIEYSGYSIAAPGSLIQAYTTPGANRSSPLLPSTATIIGSLMMPMLGFAAVSLQMPGTGCSGGAFDLFGINTTYDGYDAVQTVAAQPWVLGHRVGMVGISFSGISQFFVAGARPPGLAAIAPMSTTNDLYSTGFPGGILNSGFAASWIAARVKDALPAPEGGAAYAKALIAEGNRQCLANQALHLETRNVYGLFKGGAYRSPGLYDVRSPTTWAKKIQVPVFLVGALQDEETGPQWPAMISALSRDKNVWVSMINGTHFDSLGPATISRWLAFLDIFVAHHVPAQPPIFDALMKEVYSQATGAPSATPPPMRFTHAGTYAAARADFVRTYPRVTVFFGNGGGSLGPGAMQPVWSEGFSSWPPRRTVATTYYLGENGSLQRTKPAPGTASYRPNPALRPATSMPNGGNPWAALPPYDWAPVTGSEGLGFITPPLARDVVLVGPASLDLMLRSSAANTDIQVTVSDVQPDGEEMYVTSGFLRASDRALDSRASSVLQPVQSFLASEARPLPHGRFTEVRVPIDPIAHAFRAGSRIRITISAPGGDRPVWAFDTFQTGGKVVDTLSLGGVLPSTLVLPLVPGITPAPARPACPSLRGEPCRRYVPAGNGG
ncbi:MAG: CocE/NonD family hydrolase [Actinobacteria bacterium]|nr:CocE/NonD family hydrolase [Actinomycetota bacterium]